MGFETVDWQPITSLDFEIDIVPQLDLWLGVDGTEGFGYLYGGFRLNPFSEYVSVGFGVGYLTQHRLQDLGNSLQFKFDFRITIEWIHFGIYHLSNAYTSSWNPGMEVLYIGLAIPGL